MKKIYHPLSSIISNMTFEESEKEKIRQCDTKEMIKKIGEILEKKLEDMEELPYEYEYEEEEQVDQDEEEQDQDEEKQEQDEEKDLKYQKNIIKLYYTIILMRKPTFLIHVILLKCLMVVNVLTMQKR